MRYDFHAEVWRHAGAGWCFVTLPLEIAQGLAALSGPRVGWGSIRVTASTGRTTWRTSVFPEAQSGSLVLPLKAEVRKREGLDVGQTHAFAVELEF